MREFDADTINIINMFENITGTEVRDCLIGDVIYFLVNKGKAAIAIGKGGQRVQSAEKNFGRQIKVVEYDDNIEQFVKNLVPKAEKIEIKDGRALVTISGKNRGAVIGRGGENIKYLRELLTRNCELKELKIL